MPIQDLYCECGYADERVVYEIPNCPQCARPLKVKFPLIAYVKMKGEGGYPSRRRQIFNTTYRIHPDLNGKNIMEGK
jgi:hypothetical protein